LLSDIRTVFGGRDRITSTDLLEGLHDLDEEPWGEWFGRPLSARALAKILRPYGIQRRTIRVEHGEAATAKGFLRKQFEDVWNRYFPSNPGQKRSQGHNPHSNAENGNLKR
jgi:Protein of unknown function (DUF3631)